VHSKVFLSEISIVFFGKGLASESEYLTYSLTSAAEILPN